MVAAASLGHIRRVPFIQMADWLAAGAAASLPWSTSATSVFIVLWLIASAASLDLPDLGRAFLSPPGVVTLLMGGLALVGMAWADVPIVERLRGAEPLLRLLLIPVLMSQFRRSGAAGLVAGALLVSATVLLALSIGIFLLSIDFGRGPGVPVKDYISQSGIFMLCGFALFDLAADRVAERRWPQAAAAGVLALLFLVDIAYVTTSRTTLVIIPVAYVLWGIRRLSWKTLAGFVLTGCALGVSVWLAAPNVRERMMQIPDELATHRITGEFNSSGARLEFWKSSLAILREAPLIGHGTGSIAEAFRRHAGDLGGQSATNPHNQFFAVGIQLGALGIAVLIGMWAVHWSAFRGPGLAAWVGMLAVTQNVVGSLFNSHLMDFTQGWLYVFAVGICCGSVWRATPAPDVTVLR